MRDRTMIGILLVVIGAVLLASNLGALFRFRLSNIWPLLVAVIGFMMIHDALGEGRDRSPVFLGAVIFGVGMLHFLRGIGVIVVNSRDIWPAYLMIIGAAFILRAIVSRNADYVAPGLAIGAIGALVLAARHNLLETGVFRQIAKFWPVLLIILGAMQLIDISRRD